MAKMWQQLIVQITAIFVVIYHGSQAEVQIAAPENLNVYDKTGHSLFIEWSKVEGHILGYRVRHQRNDTPVALCNNGSLSNNSSLFVCKNVTAVLIEDLDVYKDYQVEVRAFNNETFGPNCTVAVFRTDEGIPTHPPVNVQTKADPKNATLIAVSWGEVPLEHRLGKISQYLVTVIELDDNKEGVGNDSFNVTNMNATIPGRYPFTYYNITVAAWTSKGVSNASEINQVQTAQAAPWNPPTNVNYSYDPYMLNDTFKFTWEPVVNRLNGILRGYEVRWKQVNSSTENVKTINETTDKSQRRRRRSTPTQTIAREIELKNLSLYTNYSFKVAAITVAVGKYSEKIYFKSQEGVPTAPPREVKAYNTSSKSINVSWTQPVDEYIHGNLRGYEIAYTPANGAANATRRVMLCHLNTSFHLKCLQVYTLYNITVAAFTIKGIGKASRLLQVRTGEEAPQAPPENVTAVPVNSSSIRVSWGDVPEDKRKGFISYTVIYRSRTLNDVANGSRQVHGNSVVIGDLEMFVTYSFRVQAHTKVGKGNFSDPVNQTTIQTVPKVTLNFTDRSVTNSSLKVTWNVTEKPVGLNMPDKYEIESCAVNDSCKDGSCMNNTTSTNWYELLELRGDSAYKFRARAINLTARDGTVLMHPEGNFSEHIEVTTKEGAPTQAPLNVSAKPHSQTSIRITWNEVDVCHRNGKIVEYNVEMYNSTWGQKWYGDFNNTNLGEAIVENLVYAIYRVRARARTEAGEGPYSEWHNTTTHKPAPPAPPVNVTAVAVNSSSIRVSWGDVLEDERNGFMTRYTVRYRSRTLNDVANGSRQVHGKSVVIGDLEMFVTYSFRVQAHTKVAKGNLSDPVNQTTNQTVPKVTLNFTDRSVTNSSLKVTWNVTEKPVGLNMPDKYEIESCAVDDSCKVGSCMNNTTSTNWYELLELRGGSAYKFRVRAINLTARDGTVLTHPEGNFSEQIKVTTEEGAPTQAPLDVSAKPHSETSIRITWNKVDACHRNGKIVGYNVEMYNSTSGQKWYKDVNYTTPGEAIEENLVYANYSVRVRARTKAGEGPYSEWHNTTTHKPAPTFVPQIITATATGNTTINVKWNCTGTPSNADYEGYKVRYGLRIPRSHLSTEVDRKPCEANLTRLKPFTEYFIRVAARTTQEGNYSKELSVTTHEGVPTAAPDVTWEILHSSEVRISWQRIPKPNHSGIIQGYHIEYHPEDNKTAVLKEDIKNEKLLSTVLKSLKKFSQYNIKVSAYTSVGDGPADSETFQTGDDIPSAAPINLTAINSVSPHKINVTWKPVPSGYMNGDLVDYEVNYQRVKIGGVPIDYEPVRSRITMNTTLTLENLDPYSEYEITVAARTKKGLGPRTLASYGETCPCERSFTTSWRRYEPYVNFTKDNEPGEIIPLVLRSMVRECCGKCQSYGQVELDFKHDGRSNSSERNSNQDLLDNLDESTDFTFPVSGYKEQDSYKGGYGFAPVIESAGVAFIVYPEKTQNQNTMYQSLLLCLPVLGLPIITAYIAGVIIWCLERSRNPHDFPPSFILGTWEGIWWSFVSMTTLGYGDRAPLSPRGRFFAIAWVLFGLVIISLTMAMIAAALTSITLKSEIKLYGSKVAAEFNSPEYNVGMRRNAKIDPDKPYYSVDEMTEALLNKEVEGILVDTYSAGLRGDLFNRPELRVNQIIDYKTAYGVVLGRHATQLGKCFERYLTSNRAEIFEMIKRKAKPIETSGSGETAEEDASGGLLDSGSPTFLKALRYACVSLGIALVFSLIYECIRCIRTRQKVHQNESHKAKLQEEMHALVGELNKRVLQIKMKLREKHVKQIIKYWKLQRKSMHETGMEKEWLRISTASPHNRELTISEI